jgi:hypothetical protein
VVEVDVPVDVCVLVDVLVAVVDMVDVCVVNVRSKEKA